MHRQSLAGTAKGLIKPATKGAEKTAINARFKAGPNDSFLAPSRRSE
jgi:hypothetical protein